MASNLVETEIVNKLGEPAYEFVKNKKRHLGYETSWLAYKMSELKDIQTSWVTLAKQRFGSRWMHVPDAQEVVVKEAASEMLGRTFGCEVDLSGMVGSLFNPTGYAAFVVPTEAEDSKTLTLEDVRNMLTQEYEEAELAFKARVNGVGRSKPRAVFRPKKVEPAPTPQVEVEPPDDGQREEYLIKFKVGYKRLSYSRIRNLPDLVYRHLADMSQLNTDDSPWTVRFLSKLQPRSDVFEDGKEVILCGSVVVRGRVGQHGRAVSLVNDYMAQDIGHSHDGTVVALATIVEIANYGPPPEELLAPEPELDACTVCHGSKGGVPGNENIVDGVVMCDFCRMDWLKTHPLPEPALAAPVENGTPPYSINNNLDQERDVEFAVEAVYELDSSLSAYAGMHRLIENRAEWVFTYSGITMRSVGRSPVQFPENTNHRLQGVSFRVTMRLRPGATEESAIGNIDRVMSAALRDAYDRRVAVATYVNVENAAGVVEPEMPGDVITMTVSATTDDIVGERVETIDVYDPPQVDAIARQTGKSTLNAERLEALTLAELVSLCDEVVGDRMDAESTSGERCRVSVERIWRDSANGLLVRFRHTQAENGREEGELRIVFLRDWVFKPVGE